MTTRCLRTIGCALLVVSAALAQEKPTPKTADDGPSLEVTMKFIQDKMNDQGTVGFVEVRSDLSRAIFRNYWRISDVVTDASTCTMRATKRMTTQIEVQDGFTYREGDNVVSGDALHRGRIDTSTSSFKAVQSIAVESAQDAHNRQWADAAHPDVTSSITPTVYLLSLQAATNDGFSFHSQFSEGKQPPKTNDYAFKRLWFVFRDEETANRVAKAMLHAVELCGGGSQPEPF